jgi:hypothetical protein
MFPKGNQIPRTTYEAKKILYSMGLKFVKIHACKNDSILLCGENVEEYCLKCGTSCYRQRIVEGDDGEETCRKVPRKVCSYFPIIPR